MCMNLLLENAGGLTRYNVMNSAVKFSMKAFALAACIAGPWATTLWAGEAIIIGTSKERVEPGKENKGENSMFGKSIGRGENTDPLQTLTPSLLPNNQPRNSRLNQRRQDEADEKANWLLLDKGDLTKDNETFGVNDRRYSADGLEKEDKSRDYTFRNVKGSSKPGLKNGKPNAELVRQLQQSRKDDDDSGPLLQSSKEPISLHAAPGLDFQKLFNPGKSDVGSMGSFKSQPSLGDLFGGPTSTGPEKALDSHPVIFKEFLNGPSGGSGSDPYRSSPGAFSGNAPASTPFFPAAAPSMAPSFSGSSPAQSFGQGSPFSTATPASREPDRSSSPPPLKEFPRRVF
ncbi:MAG: hypothetical protein JWM16_725 [Verrucomicrobiales bacterium]|nr:hypothetical protein [Verrucomicrobiales bacterium]